MPFVKSKWIKRADYCYPKRELRVVTKHSDKVYNYKDVPVTKYIDLMASPSKGAYLNNHIKREHEVKI